MGIRLKEASNSYLDLRLRNIKQNGNSSFLNLTATSFVLLPSALVSQVWILITWNWPIIRAVKKFLSSSLIMNSRQLWNLHQRNKFLKFWVSEMPFPGVFKMYFQLRTPCSFIRIHARLRTMPLKCPRHSTTSHSSNISQIQTCLNMRSMSFKTGKWRLNKFYSMVHIFC